MAIVRVGGDARPHREANPDVRIVSRADSFWHHVEVEYKLVTTAAAEHCLEALKTFRPAGYSIGMVHISKSFERYVRFTAGSRVFHAAVLGKRGWKRQMALKYKTPVAGVARAGLHVRAVTIAPYSRTALQEAIESHLQTRRCDIRARPLPAYYNTKARRIAVHRRLGVLFCISFGNARTLGRRGASRRQFEIEYWSRIIPKTSTDRVGSFIAQIAALTRLAGSLRRHLHSAGVRATPSSITRVQWLESLR